jgi:hypothetical protein
VTIREFLAKRYRVIRGGAIVCFLVLAAGLIIGKHYRQFWWLPVGESRWPRRDRFDYCPRCGVSFDDELHPTFGSSDRAAASSMGQGGSR